MKPFSRSASGPLSRWFWTTDLQLLGLLLVLITIGVVLAISASPGEVIRVNRSEHSHLMPMHFASKQLVFAIMAAGLMLVTSFLSPVTLRRLCIVLFPVLLLCLIMTLLGGDAAKGARRWINLPMISVQPSEFMKPVLVVLTAWILSARFDDPNAMAFEFSLLPVMAVVGLLVMQPDFGQSGLILLTWLVQAALAGMNLYWIAAGVGGVFAMILVAAQFQPHVAHRLESFFYAGAEGAFQTERALDAFRAGGLFGSGPAQGVMKLRVPDAHTDYLFALVGEEIGLLGCCAIILLYIAVVMRSGKQLLEVDKPFVFLAGAGLVVQFGLQALINLGVNVDLLPSKGMTLPFLSYGGSSALGLAFAMGMVLAFTRQNRFMAAPAGRLRPWARRSAARS